MTSAIGELQVLPVVDSSNNYAMGLIHKGEGNHGKTILALEQTAGKGRLGKDWQAKAGKNIMMSIMIKPNISIRDQFHLSEAVAVGLHKLLTKYIEETFIKWPNDLYWRDRKAAGILIENILKGNSWEWAVVGIGLNVNQTEFSKELPNPVSLKQITGKEFELISLANEIKESVIREIDNLNDGGFSAIHSYYNEHLYKRNELVRLKKDSAIFETRIKAVGTDGRLEVDDAMERSFGLDEIEWLRPETD